MEALITYQNRFYIIFLKAFNFCSDLHIMLYNNRMIKQQHTKEFKSVICYLIKASLALEHTKWPRLGCRIEV